MSPVPEGTGALLRLLAHEVDDVYAARLAPHGVRPRHVRLLRAVADSPGTTQREIGAHLGIVPSAVVPVVDDLEAVGALRRVVAPGDRRRNTLELSPRGRELLALAQRAADDADAELLAPLPARERRHLHTVLAQLLDARRPGRPAPRGEHHATPDAAGFPAH